MTIMGALLPVFGLLINVFVQVALSRAFSSLLRSIFAGFAAGLVPVICFSGFTARLPGDILCYGAFGYCYFHFLNLGETARRIRLVRELYERLEGLSEPEILRRYNSREILAVRMARLLKNGQILSHGGRYFTGKSAVLLMARMVTLAKIMVIGKKSEFDL
ncbi:MAG: hypothetical protein A2270_04685 [Elusimicrobia bacterium RIFOXYA12_FULL_51_18]|nr:MAG: hypothetical protein A2270_04685 [Elusimicrobia bacterium RIFOXYA12_FULL_51_18]OGS32873.1 MAG: hypothetical protein A2218_10740 [Elusimicrobia bacterium RIFOXYA2_FULL_53_38]